MDKAIRIYNQFCDMDAGDYVETMESDIKFVSCLLETIGEEDTIKFLTSYFE